MTILGTTRITLGIVAVAAVAFGVATWLRPYEMVFDPARCGESPIGFYRFEVTAYEYDAERAVDWHPYDPRGGTLDFARWIVGAWDPCA